MSSGRHAAPDVPGRVLGCAFVALTAASLTLLGYMGYQVESNPVANPNGLGQAPPTVQDHPPDY